MVISLTNYYEKHNTWSLLVSDKSQWKNLMSQHIIELDDKNIKQTQNKFGNQILNDRAMNKIRILHQMSLFNEKKEYILGEVNLDISELTYLDLIVKNKLVGYLAVPKANIRYQILDNIFVENFKKMILRLSIIMIIIVLFVTFPIAKYFTKSINQLAKATKKIVHGDYTVRINSKRTDELGELASNFDMLAKKLESNAAIHKSMIVDLAHEIRTPITIIKGEIEAIQDGIHLADEHTINVLGNEVDSLIHLVDDLYDLGESEIGSLKYKMAKFDVSLILKNTIDNFSAKFENKNIHIKTFIPHSHCLIVGDVYRVKQLFNNVLNNSLIYTNSCGLLDIQLSCTSDNITVSINDSAPTIDTKYLDKIFNRLYKVDSSRSEDSVGSGIGLAICNNIVLAHGGLIHAQQSKLGGLEVVIKLPIGNLNDN
jgi:two-component system sensor histidine kinase BaeS